MNSKLIIEGDQEVTIKSIKQWHTYSGLLEGMPTTKMNSQILSGVKEDAKKFCGFKEIYVIEPEQTPILFEGKYPFGDPASLPGVACIAEIWHYLPFRDETKDFSALGLVWFQNDYAFPIDNDILEKIKSIPFSKTCGEFTL